MSKRTSRHLVLGVMALSASLLLGGCGDDGGDGKSSDNIEGAGKDAKASKSASPGGGETAGQDAQGAPEFDFPKGFKVKIDPDITGDKRKDAVLRDHGYSLQAIELGYTDRDPKLKNFHRYVTGDASVQWRNNIAYYRKKGKTTTGTVLYYDRKVTLLSGGKSAAVRYCMSRRDAFDKDVKSGKVAHTKPSPKDFSSVTDRMKKSEDGTWQTVRVTNQPGDDKCAR